MTAGPQLALPEHRFRERNTEARFRAMNTDVTLHLPTSRGRAEAQQALDAVRRVFVDVERACTRFDPRSALMRANAAGGRWHDVPRVCFEAIAAAAQAHRETGGLFDPRVLESLVALGYDRTLPFESGDVRLTGDRRTAVPVPPVGGSPGPEQLWRPGLDPARGAVRIGPRPIDLGGIGKGLALRWAGGLLASGPAAPTGFLLEAGGDCLVAGYGPDGDGWKVGVENPVGPASVDRRRDRWGDDQADPVHPDDQPVAVLSLADTGCATSSLRRRTWRLDGVQVHHLVDPRTGGSAASGLRSVTVVEPDPARAEVWSKALLVAGSAAIAELAAEHRLAALWVDDEARLGLSEAMAASVIWTASDVG